MIKPTVVIVVQALMILVLSIALLLCAWFDSNHPIESPKPTPKMYQPITFIETPTPLSFATIEPTQGPYINTVPYYCQAWEALSPQPCKEECVYYGCTVERFR